MFVVQLRPSCKNEAGAHNAVEIWPELRLSNKTHAPIYNYLFQNPIHLNKNEQQQKKKILRKEKKRN